VRDTRDGFEEFNALIGGMKMHIVILAIIVIGTISSAHAQYTANYRTCSNLVPVCMNNNAKVAGVAAKCDAARRKCMETGTWTGLDGRPVSADKQ
jgi:hypothetical protein